MSLWSFNELNQALVDDLINSISNFNLAIDDVVIDSRKVKKNSLFIALKGENNDGHDYLNQVFEGGASYAIVERVPENFKNSNFLANLVIVKNTYHALDKLAIFSRNRSQGKIIAITGSVGKTSTKELLKLAFSTQGKTFANVGNFNNHIGLPLSLANLEADCQFAIFEMGMNHLNEIAPLSKIARPHLAIITTVGPVHIEFFKDEQEIALAKSEIFAGLCEGGCVILNADNKHYEFLRHQAQKRGVPDSNIFSVAQDNNGDNNGVDYKINHIKLLESLDYEVSAQIKNKDKKLYQVGTSNISSAFNSIFALACLDLIGVNLDEGLKILKEFHSSAGRGKLSDIIIDNKKITIIDDTYNASILSMKSGIENCDNLRKILGKKRMICVIGDMLELGVKSAEIHLEILKFVAEKNFSKVVLVGPHMKKANENLNLSNSINYLNSSEATKDFESFLNDGDIIYFKASRGIKMEVVIQNLISKSGVI